MRIFKAEQSNLKSVHFFVLQSTNYTIKLLFSFLWCEKKDQERFVNPSLFLYCLLTESCAHLLILRDLDKWI